MDEESLYCKGDKVRAKYHGGKNVFSGVIEKVNLDGTFVIQYDDGDREEKAKSSWILSNDEFKVGDTVMAFFRGNPKSQEFPGVISKVNKDGTLDIAYDDGDADKGLKSKLVRSFQKPSSKEHRLDSNKSKLVRSFKKPSSKEPEVGSKVMCRFRGNPKEKEYSGTVVKVSGGKIDVDYDDGDKDRRIDMSMARLVKEDSEGDASEESSDDSVESEVSKSTVAKIQIAVTKKKNGISILQKKMKQKEKSKVVNLKTLLTILREDFDLKLKQPDLQAMCNEEGKINTKTFLATIGNKDAKSDPSEEENESENSSDSAKVAKKGTCLVPSKLRKSIHSSLTSKTKVLKKFQVKLLQWDEFDEILTNELNIKSEDSKLMATLFDPTGEGETVDGGAFVYSILCSTLECSDITSALNKIRVRLSKDDDAALDDTKFNSFQKDLMKLDPDKSGSISDHKQLKLALKSHWDLKPQELTLIVGSPVFRISDAGSESSSEDEDVKSKKSKSLLSSFRRRSSSAVEAKFNYRILLALLSVGPRNSESVKKYMQSFFQGARRKGLSLNDSEKLSQTKRLKTRDLVNEVIVKLGFPLTSEEVFVILKELDSNASVESKINTKSVLDWFNKNFDSNPDSKTCRSSSMQAFNKILAKKRSLFSKLFKSKKSSSDRNASDSEEDDASFCSRLKLAEALRKSSFKGPNQIRLILELADAEMTRKVSNLHFWKTFSDGDASSNSDESDSASDGESDNEIRLMNAVEIHNTLQKYAQKLQTKKSKSARGAFTKMLIELDSEEGVEKEILVDFMQEKCLLRKNEADAMGNAFTDKNGMIEVASFVSFACDPIVSSFPNDVVNALGTLRLQFHMLTIDAQKDRHEGLLNDKVDLKDRIKKFIKKKGNKTDLKRLVENKESDEALQLLAKKFKIKVPPSVLFEIQTKLDKKKTGFADGNKLCDLVCKLSGATLERSVRQELISEFAPEDDSKLVSYFALSQIIQPVLSVPSLKRKLNNLMSMCEVSGIDIRSLVEDKQMKRKPGTIAVSKLLQVLLDTGFPLTCEETSALLNMCYIPSQQSTVKFSKLFETNEDDESSQDDESISGSSSSEADKRSMSPTRLAKNPSAWLSKLRGKPEDSDDDNSTEQVKGCILSCKSRQSFEKSITRDNKVDLINELRESCTQIDAKNTGVISSKAFQKIASKSKFLNSLSKAELHALLECFDVENKQVVLYESLIDMCYPLWTADIASFVAIIRKSLDKKTKPLASLIKKHAERGTVSHHDVTTILTKLKLDIKRSERTFLMGVLDPHKTGRVNCNYMAQVLSPTKSTSLASRVNHAFSILSSRKVSVDSVIDNFAGDDEDYLDFQRMADFVSFLGIPLANIDLCSLCDALDEGEDREKISIDRLEAFVKSQGKLKEPKTKKAHSDSDEHNHDSDSNMSDSKSKVSRHPSDASSMSSSGKSVSDKEDNKSVSSDSSGGKSGSDTEDDKSDMSSIQSSHSDLSGFSSDASPKKFKSKKRADSDNESLESPPKKMSATDAAYNTALEKMLRKAFVIVDTDRSGYVEKKEIVKVMTGLGRDCSHRDIDEMMRLGDKNHDGKLDRKEFVSLVNKLVRRGQGQLNPQREQEIRALFIAIDTDRNGSLSIDEFSRGLYELLGHKLKSTEMKRLVSLVDRNKDGEISYDEFIDMVRTIGSNSKLPSKDVQILKDIARGPVPDVASFLRTYIAMPTNARPGVMQELDKSMDHTLEVALLAETKVKPKKSTTFVISMKVARGIPVIEPTVNLKIINRRARICLWESGDMSNHLFEEQDQRKRTPSTSMAFAGNAYSLNAAWIEAEEDVWKFSTTSDACTFVVRVSDSLRDECVSRGNMLNLLVELTATVESGRDTVEVGCGWCCVQLQQLEKAAATSYAVDAPVQGGTPTAPSDILDIDVKTRRSGWRAIIKKVRPSLVKPVIRLKCVDVKHASGAVRDTISALPRTIITAFTSLPLIQVYRDMKMHLRVSRSGNSAVDGVRCDPVMRIFPQIMQDADLLSLIFKKWQKGGGASIRNKERRITKFSNLVLSFWPMLVAIERRHSQPAAESGSALLSASARDFRRSTNPTAFFSSVPDESKENPKQDQNKPSDHGGVLMFKPFNINETVML